MTAAAKTRTLKMHSPSEFTTTRIVTLRFYRPDALPADQPTVSKAEKGIKCNETSQERIMKYWKQPNEIQRTSYVGVHQNFLQTTASFISKEWESEWVGFNVPINTL